MVLTLSNADVLELNFRLRTAFKKLGVLGDIEARLKVNNGIESFEADFSVGDEVLLRANDRNMMVYAIDPDAPLDKPSAWKPIRLGVFNRNSGRIVNVRRSRNPVGSWDITIDLAGDSRFADLLGKDGVKTGRACILVLGVAGMLLSLWAKSIIGFLLIAYDIYAYGVVLPVFFGMLLRVPSILWRRCKA